MTSRLFIGFNFWSHKTNRIHTFYTLVKASALVIEAGRESILNGGREKRIEYA